MTTDSTTTVDDATLFLGEAWSDPIEAGIRDRIRGFIEELIEEELAAALDRGRYERGRPRRRDGEPGSADGPPAAETADFAPLDGHRHGHRERRITGSFGTVEIAVPRARIGGAGGLGREWRSKVLPRYARMTRQVEALIAGTYLAGTNTRRVRRALAALFKGGDRQGRGQPHLAEGEDGLGSLVEAPARRGGHRPADPRRHRRARPARQEGDIDLAAGCPRRPSRRAEGAARREEHGWRERGRLAGAARRSRRPRAEDARVPDHRRRRRPRESAGGAVAGSADAAAPSTSTATCSRTPRTSCTRRSRPTTPT